MMTAKEARETSENAFCQIEEELLKELLVRAEKAIKECSLSGKTYGYVKVAGYTSEVIRRAVRHLRTLGYECNKIQVDYLKISW